MEVRLLPPEPPAPGSRPGTSTIGAQVVIGTVEGVAGIRGWDYTETLDERWVVWMPVVGLAMLAFGSLHAWRWRAVRRSPGSPPTRA